MFRAAYDYSAFSNKYNSIVWDNPLQVVDYDNGLLPTAGPYDPSGYSNGNGPAMGRISAFPDSSMSVVSFMGLSKIARRTSLNGTVQVVNQSQNDDLIPYTTNSVINQPAVWAAFPELASLQRTTAEAKVRSVNALMNFSTRMANNVGFTAKYRHNTHANLTRPYDAVEYVRFDAVPEETGSETEGHDIVRDTFDTAVSYKVMPFSTVRLGYGYDNFNRTGRAHNDMRDQALRLTWDATGFQYLSVRAGYERVWRKGFGFSEMALEEGGAQPGLRFYDEANLNRDRVNIVATLMPMDTVDVTASLVYGKDAYGGPGAEFGLLDNKNTSFTIGVNFTPMATLDCGASYGRDKYTAFQKSRNANPPPDPSFNDPSRDWTLDNDETVNNFDLYSEPEPDTEEHRPQRELHVQRLGQRLHVWRAADLRAGGRRPVPGPAQRDERLASTACGFEVLRHHESGRRRRLVVREVRRRRLRDHRSARAARHSTDRIPR